MKRAAIAIAVVMFAAVASNAAMIHVSADGFINLAGYVGTVRITLTVLPGGETVNSFSAYEVRVGWDHTVVRVWGSDGVTTFGTSSQSPIIAGLSSLSSGPIRCTSSGPNKGKTCVVIRQANPGAPVFVPGGTVVIGTLQLEVLGGDPPGSSIGLSIVAYNNNGVTNPLADPNLTIDPSFPGASLGDVPEPTTATLLGLGLVGLGIAARRPI